MKHRVQMVIAVLVLVGAAASSPVRAQSLDELHKAAAKEGALNFYATLAQINAEIVLPTFEKRFPGIKINHEYWRNRSRRRAARHLSAAEEQVCGEFYRLDESAYWTGCPTRR